MFIVPTYLLPIYYILSVTRGRSYILSNRLYKSIQFIRCKISYVSRVQQCKLFKLLNILDREFN